MRNLFLKLSLLCICVASTAAHACIGPNKFSRNYSPACKIPVAEDNESIAIVDVENSMYPGASASVLLGKEEFARPIGIIDVDIAPNAKKKIYLVLSSAYPAIWRINGAVEKISRIIALGHLYLQRHRNDLIVGVVGVEKEKIEFPVPAIRGSSVSPKFSIWVDKAGISGPSTCDGYDRACKPRNFLFRFPVSKTIRQAVVLTNESETRYPDAWSRRFYSSTAPGIIPGRYLERPKTINDRIKDPEGVVSVRFSKPKRQRKDIVYVDPSEVISPTVVYKRSDIKH